MNEPLFRDDPPRSDVAQSPSPMVRSPTRIRTPDQLAKEHAERLATDAAWAESDARRRRATTVIGAIVPAIIFALFALITGGRGRDLIPPIAIAASCGALVVGLRLHTVIAIPLFSALGGGLFFLGSLAGARGLMRLLVLFPFTICALVMAGLACAMVVEFADDG